MSPYSLAANGQYECSPKRVVPMNGCFRSTLCAEKYLCIFGTAYRCRRGISRLKRPLSTDNSLPLCLHISLHQNNRKSHRETHPPPKMSQIPVTEVCIIDLKAPYDLKDPSTPEGAIWASSISTLKKCPGFRDIYTSSVVEDRGKARMFLSKCLFSFPPFFFAPGMVSKMWLFEKLNSFEFGYQFETLRRW